MNERRRKAVGAEDLHRIFKPEKLIARKVLFCFIVSRGEMRHQSIDANVREPGGGLCEFGDLISAHTETSHPRVDFNVNIRG